MFPLYPKFKLTQAKRLNKNEKVKISNEIYH